MTTARQRVHGALVPALVLLAACSTSGARVHAGYMQSQLSGSASLTASVPGARASARASVDEGLGLSDDAASLYVRAELNAGPVRVSGSAFRYQQSGTGVLDVAFGDITAGTRVDSDVSLGVLKTSLTFDLLEFGPFRLSPGLGADLMDLDATVTDASGLTSTSERIDELVPIPMLLVQSALDFGAVEASVELGGMDVRYDEFAATLVDVEALLVARPVDHVELFAGYRWISLEADGESGDGDFTTDLVLRGWFLGGGLRF